jgi:hypothetical protein
VPAVPRIRKNFFGPFFRNRGTSRPVQPGKETIMTKPPGAPHHSDIDGVAEDERRNTDAAIESGQDAANLELARREAVGRPPERDKPEPKDDRSR